MLSAHTGQETTAPIVYHDAGMLQSLAARYRAAMARECDAVDVGPFRAYLSRFSDDYLQSVAVPVAREADWRAAMGPLREAFGRRRLRLEFFAELAPGLEAACPVVERRDPVLVVKAGSLRLGPVTGLRFHRLAAGDPLIDAFLALQGQGGWFTRGLADGAFRAGALLDGDAVACGAVLLPSGELAGVATPPRYRRRGLATDLCGRMIADAFERGDDLCWLSADESGLGVYRRLGFERVGTQVNAAASPDNS